jgi:lambda repressor-like predicted transcriptional regulator
MSDIANAIACIRRAADRSSVAELAREAGVPYTTVHSFADRKWSHKNLEVIQKLEKAAERINARTAPKDGEDGEAVA